MLAKRFFTLFLFMFAVGVALPGHAKEVSAANIKSMYFNPQMRGFTDLHKVLNQIPRPGHMNSEKRVLGGMPLDRLQELAEPHEGLKESLEKLLTVAEGILSADQFEGFKRTAVVQLDGKKGEIFVSSYDKGLLKDFGKRSIGDIYEAATGGKDEVNGVDTHRGFLVGSAKVTGNWVVPDSNVFSVSTIIQISNVSVADGVVNVGFGRDVFMYAPYKNPDPYAEEVAPAPEVVAEEKSEAVEVETPVEVKKVGIPGKRGIPYYDTNAEGFNEEHKLLNTLPNPSYKTMGGGYFRGRSLADVLKEAESFPELKKAFEDMMMVAKAPLAESMQKRFEETAIVHRRGDIVYISSNDSQILKSFGRRTLGKIFGDAKEAVSDVKIGRGFTKDDYKVTGNMLGFGDSNFYGVEARIGVPGAWVDPLEVLLSFWADGKLYEGKYVDPADSNNYNRQHFETGEMNLR